MPTRTAVAEEALDQGKGEGFVAAISFHGTPLTRCSFCRRTSLNPTSPEYAFGLAEFLFSGPKACFPGLEASSVGFRPLLPDSKPLFPG